MQAEEGMGRKKINNLKCTQKQLSIQLLLQVLICMLFESFSGG